MIALTNKETRILFTNLPINQRWKLSYYEENKNELEPEFLSEINDDINENTNSRNEKVHSFKRYNINYSIKNPSKSNGPGRPLSVNQRKKGP